jgi:hypothetical protein
LTLAQITAKHFVAAILLDNDVVVQVAPILKYMRGWSRDRVRAYCAEKKWEIKVIRS